MTNPTDRCPAAVHAHQGAIAFRCDRLAVHPGWHYDVAQDAAWTLTDTPGLDETPPVLTLRVNYRLDRDASAEATR